VKGLDAVMRREFHGHMQLEYIQGVEGPTATVQVVIQKYTQSAVEVLILYKDIRESQVLMSADFNRSHIIHFHAMEVYYHFRYSVFFNPGSFCMSRYFPSQDVPHLRIFSI